MSASEQRAHNRGPGSAEHRPDEADAAWIDLLAREGDEPLSDGETFAARVLAQWETSAGEAGAEAEEAVGGATLAAGPPEAPAPRSISRWWPFAAALVAAAGLSYLAGLQSGGGPAAPEHAAPRHGAIADAATDADPLGILLQDVGRQMEQRPDQFRRAVSIAAAWLGGSSDAERETESPERGNGADDRNS